MDRSRNSPEDLSSGDRRNGLDIKRSDYSVEETEKGYGKATDKQMKSKPNNMGRRVSSLQTFDPKDREKYRDIFKELRTEIHVNRTRPKYNDTTEDRFRNYILKTCIDADENYSVCKAKLKRLGPPQNQSKLLTVTSFVKGLYTQQK